MRRGDPVVGREEMISWIKRQYPMLKPDPLDPLSYKSVIFNHMRPGGEIFERVELVDATIEKINEDGSIVWSYRRIRVRPWWRVFSRLWRRVTRRPLSLEGR